MNALNRLIPAPPSWVIDWLGLEPQLQSFISALAKTQQNPLHHGEGDVWTHTKLVCQALTNMADFRSLDADLRTALFLAALLHDVGKPRTTRLEDGRWISPHHAAAGASLARVFLWQSMGLCGTRPSQQLREMICLLIRYHTIPTHMIDDPDAPRRLRVIASHGALCPGFSFYFLCILAQADVQGRICTDQGQLLDQIALCAELAKEMGCYAAPYPFPTVHTRFAYLSGRDITPEIPLYDNTWGSVMMVSGLPGTGKDTWIASNYPELPVISLDDIRKELHILPTDPQTVVVNTSRDRARQLLRRKQPFVWNATNLTPQVRQHQLQLFADYGASTEIRYLETTWEEQLRRNNRRSDAVPEAAICSMLERLTPPGLYESQWVCWNTL